jgi:hypothetical protein
MIKKANDNDFKIIAIKIGQECPEVLSKVLIKNYPYYFYSDYKLTDQDDFSSFPKTEEQLYSLAGGPNINISAIAGQNGTGKSTLIEFLFMAMNNLAEKLDIKDDLVAVENLEVTIFFKDVDYYRFYIKGTTPSLFAYDELGLLRRDELFEEKKEILERFFYTIAVNYSHYAYNSRDLIRKRQKDWLSPLFHKNDSYQTPIVINPYRKEGDIKINTENDLVRQRLLANLLRVDQDTKLNFRLLTDNLYASHLWLKLWAGKSSEVLYEEKTINGDDESTMRWKLKDLDIDYNEVLLKINEAVEINYQDNDYETAQPYREAALTYLVRKLITMSVKYQDYEGYFDETTHHLDIDRIVDYVNRLMTDPSHIAYKFHQTVNYLRYGTYSVSEIGKTALPISIVAARIAKFIGDHPDEELRIIDLLPPPIFETDIFLSTEADEKQEMIAFDTLSSGEKQLVYSVSSILYHLSNLESVVSWDDKPKQKYPLINIIFEEIELYFHPELQRKYIKYLRDNIDRLHLQTIKAINLIFVTHSPFILSDIPKQNIMFLKIKEKRSVQVDQEKKTFGANIHNLLSDGFFMHSGLCGAYALEKINEIIKALNSKKELGSLENKINDKKYKMNPVETDRYNELTKEINKIDFMPFPAIIAMIGENIIAIKLRQMYDEAFGLDQSDWIRKEIKRLEGLLNLPHNVSN